MTRDLARRVAGPDGLSVGSLINLLREEQIPPAYVIVVREGRTNYHVGHAHVDTVEKRIVLTLDLAEDIES